MTREEQIEKAWLAFAVQSIYRYDEKSVKDAIKWADEHPNLYNDEKYHTVRVSDLDKLYRKAKMYDTFLEKACEWLNNMDNIEKYLHVRTTLVNDLVKAFRKAMNE